MGARRRRLPSPARPRARLIAYRSAVDAIDSSGFRPLFSRLAAGTAAVAILGLAGCDRAHEDRAADAASQAVREASQALSKAGKAAREGLGEAGAAVKEGAEAAGEVLADAALTARVKTALLADEPIPGERIDVHASGSTVILSGRVADAGQIERALGIARSIDGVTRVENRLRAQASR